MNELLSWGTLIFRLGIAVWNAVEAGETHRTVGEIFAGVPKDETELERLREAARRKFRDP